MDGLMALLIILVIYSAGEIISFKTKSKIPMMVVASISFLAGFWWLGLPSTIFQDAQLAGFGTLMIGLLITHMGTMLSFKELVEQWKTVLVAISAVIGVGVFLFIVGSPILGREYATAAAPPIAGGTVAVVIMSEAAKTKGIESIALFVTLVVVMQGYFGYPVASFMLNREAKRILKIYRETGIDVSAVGAGSGVGVAQANEVVKPKKKLIKEMPKELQTPYVLLAKLTFVAYLSIKFANLLKDVIHPYVMCLLIGVVASEIGFLEKNIMNKANSFGLAMLGLMGVVMGNLSNSTPQMVLSMIVPILTALTLGVIGIIIFASIAGKFLGYTFEMAIAIGCTCLFGFPGTFILSNEVAKGIGETDEEREVVLGHILPKMLVAGFVTVTIASVVLAGFMSKLI